MGNAAFLDQEILTSHFRLGEYDSWYISFYLWIKLHSHFIFLLFEFKEQHLKGKDMIKIEKDIITTSKNYTEF